jgi:hypothetical protein
VLVTAPAADADEIDLDDVLGGGGGGGDDRAEASAPDRMSAAGPAHAVPARDADEIPLDEVLLPPPPPPIVAPAPDSL